ncbi:MAG: hypothetical protein RR342_04185 [Bacilli bacterium]
MEKELIEKLFKLKEDIALSNEKDSLDFLDKEISLNKEINVLSSVVTTEAKAYSDAINLHLGEIENTKNNFEKAKLNLENNTLVISYYAAYREYKDIFDYFNLKIIEPFNVGIKI